MPELNWLGQPIRPGEGYGGRPENIPKTFGQKPALAAVTSQLVTSQLVTGAAKQHQHYAVITESHLAEVFGNGSRKLTRTEAAKRLELLTGTHRTSCYRALRLNGRFSRHLHSDGTTLSWRSL